MTPIHEILSGWLAAAGMTPAQVAAKLPARQAGKTSMSGWGLKLYLLGRTTPPGEVVRQIGEVCGRDRFEVAAAVLQAAGDVMTAGELRDEDGVRWFVVHQRDGVPMVDSFIGAGAERAAKLTARLYAAQWTDVYVMRGRPVSSADFEAEARAGREDMARREVAP